MITSNIKQKMEDKKVTVRHMMAVTGLANETILRARDERITLCQLATLERIAMCLGCRTKDLYEES